MQVKVQLLRSSVDEIAATLFHIFCDCVKHIIVIFFHILNEERLFTVQKVCEIVFWQFTDQFPYTIFCQNFLKQLYLLSIQTNEIFDICTPEFA